MVTVYHMRTVLYLGALTGLFLGIGYLLGGFEGALAAFFLATLLNVGSYWFSDKIVLALYQAKPLPREQAPELYTMVQELCTKYQLPLPRIYHIKDPSPNAFATGRNEQHAVLGITTGILDLMTLDELRGVLAHELSHIKNKDMLISTMAATLAGAISFLARSIYFFGGNDDRRSETLSFIFFLIVTPILAILIQFAVSRTREYEADASGARLLGEGTTLAAALRKLKDGIARHPMHAAGGQAATAHLFIVNPFSLGFVGKLFSTHPPLDDRIARLERWNQQSQ